MTEICPLCGANWKNSLTCQEMFDEFLALEFSDAAYGKVHLLTVTCFMIQHQRHSDQALSWMRDTLDEVLNKGVSASDIRLRMTSDVDQANRKWKIERQPHEQALPPADWSITIADVYPYKDDPQKYCTWARATLLEMKFEG